MKLKSAREAWAAAYYTPWDSISSVMAEQAALGIVEGGGMITRKRNDVDEQGKPVVHKERVFCPGVRQDRGGRRPSASKAANQALAGCIQRAIGTLQPGIRSFGHHMYSALATTADREAAEDLVWEWFESRAIYHDMRMTAVKRERAYYVTKLCLHRYRRLHQGGMSAGIDPVPNPEKFREAMDEVYGVTLASSNWDRDWGKPIEMIMAICSDIDKLALAPVSACLMEMKEAA
ncbi:hypothetical protein M1D96_06465 [Pseudomonas sp. D1-3]